MQFPLCRDFFFRQKTAFADGDSPLFPRESSLLPSDSSLIARRVVSSMPSPPHFEDYLAPFRLLHSRQSIWQLSSVVRPPSRHGVMWSPSMRVKSNSFWQSGQTCFCRSHTASLMSSGKVRRSRKCSSRVRT